MFYAFLYPVFQDMDLFDQFPYHLAHAGQPQTISFIFCSLTVILSISLWMKAGNY